MEGEQTIPTESIGEDRPVDSAPPAYNDQQDITASLESMRSEEVIQDEPMHASDQQLPGSVETIRPQNDVTNQPLPGSVETLPFQNDERQFATIHSSAQQDMPRSMALTHSDMIIENPSHEEIAGKPVLVTTAQTSEPQNGDTWMSEEKLVWPAGSKKWRATFLCLGKSELIFGIYFLVFGISSLIVTLQVYDQYHIAEYGGVAGLGVLLIIAGSAKSCGSPSRSNTPCSILFTGLSLLGAGALAGWCIYRVNAGQKVVKAVAQLGSSQLTALVAETVDQKFRARWGIPVMTVVASATAGVTFLLCLVHLICYVKKGNIPMERVHVVVHTNTRTGEKLFDIVRPQPPNEEMRRAQSAQWNTSMAGSHQNVSAYHQQPAIAMSNIGRSTSMRTIQNQYVERSNHELPQQYHTVHRHPITMQQHRQQEMRYAQSEFNSNRPNDQVNYIQERSITQPNAHSQPYAQSDYGQRRAMTEIDYPHARTIVNQSYAQSEVGQPRARTELDYPQPRTTENRPYAHSEMGNPRAKVEVDYSQTRATPSPKYAQSEVGQPGYAQTMSTPTRQYFQSPANHPATLARYPQHMSDSTYPRPTRPSAPEPAYPHNMPNAEYNNMQGQIHPQAEIGFRTVPMHHHDAPSEAGFSYAPSESGYQSGRISPRVALAMNQMKIDAAKQEFLQRQQLARDGSQQYMVATRPYH